MLQRTSRRDGFFPRMSLSLVSLVLIWSCGDGPEPTEIENEVPVITELVAGPEMVCSSRSSTIAAQVSDPEGGDLTFSWNTDGGEFAGEGPTIAWNAPEDLGTYTITLTVTDPDGGTASKSLEVEVRQGTLLVSTRSGLFAAELAGNSWTLSDRTGVVDAYGDRVFLSSQGSSRIQELDPLSGNLIRTITAQPVGGTDPSGVAFVALPGANFALLDNVQEQVWLLDSLGVSVAQIPIGTPTQTMQNMGGAVSGDRLHVCCKENGEFVFVDLDTYSYGTYSVQGFEGAGIGDIEYASGKFFLSESRLVHEVTPPGTRRELFSTGSEFHVTGLAVVGPYLYSTVNFAGKVYRTHRATGVTELFLEGLVMPTGISCLALDLVPS